MSWSYTYLVLLPLMINPSHARFCPPPDSSSEASVRSGDRRSRSLSPAPSRRTSAASSSLAAGAAGSAAASVTSQGLNSATTRKGLVASSGMVAPKASANSSRGGNGNESWDPKVAGELLADDDVPDEPAASGSDHSTGEEGGNAARGDVSSQRQHHQQEGGIISRVKGMQDRAGRTQVSNTLAFLSDIHSRGRRIYNFGWLNVRACVFSPSWSLALVLRAPPPAFGSLPPRLQQLRYTSRQVVDGSLQVNQ